MSLEGKDQRLLISLGFVFLVLLLVPNGYRSILIILLDFKDSNSYEMFKKLFNVFHFIISGLLVIAGFWFGRRVNLDKNYRRYINGLAISWALALSFIGILCFFSDDLYRTVYQIAASLGLGGYRYLASLFSGITLGWLVKGRPVISVEWNKDVLRYVSVYQGAVLVRSVGLSYIAAVYLYPGRSIQAFGLYVQVSSLLLTLVNLWYLWKMYNMGKKVELETEYNDILWTLWVPRLVVILITSLANMIANQTTFADCLINLVEDIIYSPVNLFETPFALLCFGYIHSRYRFVEKLEE